MAKERGAGIYNGIEAPPLDYVADRTTENG
jgi:hypothetical protein